MNKKQVIEKIMEEYSQYGLSRIEVEISYLLAILWRVPKDSIYHGMRVIFNNVYGIKNEKAESDAGEALFNHAISEVKVENPTANDNDIADGIEYIGIDTLKDSLEDINFALLGRVKEYMLQSAKQYVDKNISETQTE